MSRQDGLVGQLFQFQTKKGEIFMSSHEFDAWLETQPLPEPTYDEQVLLAQEIEEAHDAELKQQGAVDALQNLSITLSVLCLRDEAKGDYYFGLHDALEVVRRNLDITRGGIA